MKKFSIILAVDNENWLWKNWGLSWDIPDDRSYFKNVTTRTKNHKKQNAVVMGRKTWDSLPKKFRPLPLRLNCVLSRSYEDEVIWESWEIKFSETKKCMEYLSKRDDIENIFIIWWAEIYNQVLSSPCLEKAYVTRIYEKYHCDVFFDGLPVVFEEVSRSPVKTHEDIEYEYYVYKRKKKFMDKFLHYFKK